MGRRALAAVILFITLCSCGGKQDEEEQVSASTETPDKTIRLCLQSEPVVQESAVRMREEIQRPSTSRSQLVSIVNVLKEDLERCSHGFTAIDAEIVGGLHVLLGNRLLALQEYSEAGDVFAAAASVLERFGAPSFMWLAALQGAARVEIEQGDVATAKELAVQQTLLARTWVNRREFVSSALVSALKFEAAISETSLNFDRANELREEADNLEAQD